MYLASSLSGKLCTIMYLITKQLRVLCNCIVVLDFDKDTTNGICPRYSNWNDTNCKGLMKRWICNFAMGDVPNAINSGCIWMNKFDLNVDAEAVVCVREFLLR